MLLWGREQQRVTILDFVGGTQTAAHSSCLLQISNHTPGCSSTQTTMVRVWTPGLILKSLPLISSPCHFCFAIYRHLELTCPFINKVVGSCTISLWYFCIWYSAWNIVDLQNIVFFGWTMSNEWTEFGCKAPGSDLGMQSNAHVSEGKSFNILVLNGTTGKMKTKNTHLRIVRWYLWGTSQEGAS